MLEVVLRPRAEADLDHIAQYTIAEWGQTQAARYLADLRRQINFAAEFPDAGSPAFGLPDQYRKVRAGMHHAIYRRSDTQLLVVRVIHSSEDVPDEDGDFW